MRILFRKLEKVFFSLFVEKLTSKSWDSDGYFNPVSGGLRVEDDPINANSSHSSSGLHGRFSSHCDIITQETRSVLCNSHDGQKL